jgi:hypothetical protein
MNAESLPKPIRAVVMIMRRMGFRFVAVANTEPLYGVILRRLHHTRWYLG